MPTIEELVELGWSDSQIYEYVNSILMDESPHGDSDLDVAEMIGRTDLLPSDDDD